MSEQVGGGHYESDYQHWDLISYHGVGYLEGCATKYIVRWRKKDGVEDLKKALHYTKKLYSLHKDHDKRVFKCHVPLTELYKFFEANPHLEKLEKEVITALLQWILPSRLGKTIDMIEGMIYAASNMDSKD